MSRAQRSALVVLAVAVAAIAAQSVHAFFLVDACVDAGGRYLRDPPRCEVAPGVRRALTALPRRAGWWAFVVVPALAVGGLVYVAGRAVLARAPRGPG
jgi:hypothetical protein